MSSREFRESLIKNAFELFVFYLIA